MVEKPWEKRKVIKSDDFFSDDRMQGHRHKGRNFGGHLPLT